MPTIVDSFDHDPTDGSIPIVGRGDLDRPSSWWPPPVARHAQIRETCETIQQVAITIAIPVFAVLTALLLAGLARAVWMF